MNRRRDPPGSMQKHEETGSSGILTCQARCGGVLRETPLDPAIQPKHKGDFTG